MRLCAAPVAAAMQAALEAAAGRVQAAVEQALSDTPGEAHDAPWLRTGALRASLSHRVAEHEAVVGSTSEVAVFQERGTSSVPPRPFLAPAAARLAPELARDVGQAVASAVGGNTETARGGNG